MNDLIEPQLLLPLHGFLPQQILLGLLLTLLGAVGNIIERDALSLVGFRNIFFLTELRLGEPPGSGLCQLSEGFVIFSSDKV